MDKEDFTDKMIQDRAQSCYDFRQYYPGQMWELITSIFYKGYDKGFTNGQSATLDAFKEDVKQRIIEGVMNDE